MWVRRALRIVLLVFTSTQIVSCLQKGSLTYVIDTTPSMTAEINQVKQSTDSITKVVFDEKSSQINNMVLVTFSDPNADLKIVTDNRNVFKQNINQVGIVWPNVYDCPEMSMAGTLLALKHSLPGSYIYVFTDASAKDFQKSNEVLKMCQEKQSQIVFILTGDCNDFETYPYQVYFDIAAGCSGLAFYIQKNDVFSIFEPIKDAIKGKKELITSRTIPAHTTKDIPFEIKDESEYASVTASGKGVTLKVWGTTHLDFQTERLTWLDNVKMLRLSRLKPGTYIATVHSSSLTTISIFSRTDFSFDYGFSGLDAQTLNDTLPQPIPNTSTRLFVSVTDPKHTTDIKSVLILDMHENIMPNFNLPLRRINDNYYVTPAFVAPSSSFKIAVYGKAVKTGKDIRRLARFPITPQPAEKVSVPQPSGKTSESVNTGTSVDIECTATKSVPAPKITWEFMANGKSKFVPIPGSDNILHIKTVHKEDAGRYKCTASNIAGISEHVTTLVVKFKPIITTDNSTVYEGLESDKTLKIPCDVDGYPPAKISWSVDGVDITNGPHYSISDGALIISNPKIADSKTYKCKATNYLGSSHAEFNVKVKGVPYINSKDSKSYKGLDGDVALKIPCDAVGIPPPIISWSVNGKKITAGPHYSISGGVLIIKNPKMVDSGTYRCEATNYLGSTHADFDVKISVKPIITTDNSTVYEGLESDKTLKIPCDVEGYPPAKISWSVDGVDITNGSHYFISDGALIISNPKIADSKTYKCKATNYLGSSHAEFNVKVKGVPYINSKDSKSYKGLDGDVALRIPCDAIGIPPPIISWSVNGKKFTAGPHYSISGGVLIIKDPKTVDSGTYRCEATNYLGSTHADFDVKINEHLDDYGPIEEIKINKLQNTSFRLECGLPGQSVRWFLEGIDINVKGNYLEITDLDEAYNGNYTCRVSDMEKSFTKTFHLVIDGPPKFQFEQEDPIIDWNGIDELNCDIESTKNIKVEWTYNGEVLSDHKSLMLGVGGKWGHYTCNVSNDFGAIQRTFDVISSRCLVPKDKKEYGHMPIILNERSTWPTTAVANYIIFEHAEKITVYCPNDNGKENRFKNFPSLKEITALCDKQDTFIVNGKPHKITEMGCDHYITPTVIFENKQCGKGKTKSIAVGYNNVPSFMETYEVCYDTLNNIPQYSLVVMPRNYLSRDEDYKWYKHPKINFKTDDSVYTCKDSTSKCCYSKSQLVSVRDFSPGPAQSTTFIESINSIPLWQPCHKPTTSWDDIDEMIRWQLDLLPASVVWSGTHMIQKKNGHLVPRYLFKLVEFIDSRPIAIVYVNGPSPTNADILCKNICANDDNDEPWLEDMGDHIYCCNGEDFREAFNFFQHKHVNIDM